MLILNDVVLTEVIYGSDRAINQSSAKHVEAEDFIDAIGNALVKYPFVDCGLFWIELVLKQPVDVVTRMLKVKLKLLTVI